MRAAERFVIGWSGWDSNSPRNSFRFLSRKACYRLALLLGSLGAMLDNFIAKGHAEITQGNTPDPAPYALPYAMGVRL